MSGIMELLLALIVAAILVGLGTCIVLTLIQLCKDVFTDD